MCWFNSLFGEVAFDLWLDDPISKCSCGAVYLQASTVVGPVILDNSLQNDNDALRGVHSTHTPKTLGR